MLRSKRNWVGLIGMLILTALLAACIPGTGPVPGNQPSPTSPPAVESPALPAAPSTAAPTLPSEQSVLVNTQWNLVSMGAPGAEAPAVADTSVTLEFGPGGQAVGSGGCNSYSSPYAIQNGTLSFGTVVSTKMACTAAGVMEQEQAYFQALESGGEFEQSGDQLVIHYNDGQGILNFVRSSSAPTEAPSADATPGSTSAAEVLCAVPGPGSISGWELCQSPQFGFEFQYPDQGNLINQTADTARIDLPITSGTNLNEKYLDVSVTQGAATCTSPLGEGYAPGSIPTENVQVNGLEFLKETGQEGAAGSNYDWTAYSTQMNGVCVSLGFVLHSHHPDLDPTPPPEFDKAAESQVFGDIVSTFRWLDSDSGTPAANEVFLPDIAVTGATATAAVQPTPAPQRITFASGATSARVSGDLPASGSDIYVVRAQAGQTMTVDLSFTQGRAILAVWGADGNVLMSDHAEASSFGGRLPSTQDYFIQLKGRPNGATVYQLEVTIPPLTANPSPTAEPQRISFRAGATSATVSGDLAASESDLYTLRALEGQTMNVDLTFSRGRAILVVWGADGTVLMSDHAGASSFSGRLPSTQDYFIRVVGRPDGRTDYQMTVNIPPANATPAPTPAPERISFRTGATSATVSGDLAASGSDLYVIRALSGQTMTVDLSFSEGRAILAVWGADGNVLMSDHAEASSFSGRLPSTQDYFILLKGRPDGRTSYTMEVSIPPR